MKIKLLVILLILAVLITGCSENAQQQTINTNTTKQKNIVQNTTMPSITNQDSAENKTKNQENAKQTENLQKTSKAITEKTFPTIGETIDKNKEIKLTSAKYEFITSPLLNEDWEQKAIKEGTPDKIKTEIKELFEQKKQAGINDKENEEIDQKIWAYEKYLNINLRVTYLIKHEIAYNFERYFSLIKDPLKSETIRRYYYNYDPNEYSGLKIEDLYQVSDLQSNKVYLIIEFMSEIVSNAQKYYCEGSNGKLTCDLDTLDSRPDIYIFELDLSKIERAKNIY